MRVIQTFFILFLLLLSLSSEAAQTKSRRFKGFHEGLIGVGLLFGEPASFRTHYFTNWKRAFSFSGGYSFARVGVVSLDYLLYGYTVEDKRKSDDFWNSLAFYGGAGVMGGGGLGGHAVEDQYQIGLRAVGGIEYIFIGNPLSLRIEGSPQYLFKGKNTLGFAIGLGLTYYFFDNGPRNKRFGGVEDFTEFD
ncbi:MAG: hypothetical protein SGI74_14875 [Oligoflexia bacterium]|nr:hypothetical protein [Oligoflexia bacterium]